MRPLGRIDVLDLFPPERTALLDLLESLDAVDWRRPTVCAGWDVKDLAAHVLGDDVGRLSYGRDGFAHGWLSGEHSWDELIAFINRQNESWVEAARRLSPQVIIDMLRESGAWVRRYMEALDLDAIGGPVDWAGPEAAPVWLDVAREYTERWAHQQQIRDATARPGLKERRFFAPVIDTFMRALPHTFRGVNAPDGTTALVRISGDAGGEWRLVRDGGRWLLAAGDGVADATVTLDAERAWRLMTKGIPKDEAVAAARVEGDAGLAGHVFGVLSILA